MPHFHLSFSADAKQDSHFTATRTGPTSIDVTGSVHVHGGVHWHLGHPSGTIPFSDTETITIHVNPTQNNIPFDGTSGHIHYRGKASFEAPSSVKLSDVFFRAHFVVHAAGHKIEGDTPEIGPFEFDIPL